MTSRLFPTFLGLCMPWPPPTHIDSRSKAGDEGSADLLTQRMQVHEKTAWMLRSLLG